MNESGSASGRETLAAQATSPTRVRFVPGWPGHVASLRSGHGHGPIISRIDVIRVTGGGMDVATESHNLNCRVFPCPTVTNNFKAADPYPAGCRRCVIVTDLKAEHLVLIRYQRAPICVYCCKFEAFRSGWPRWLAVCDRDGCFDVCQNVFCDSFSQC